ncbi:uncharacterized protein LOC114934810 [Nylanderia fulva]|uniref:uncharacterized protein LOC114934810 n=1 Tax=Nylanderia fulva TaxID=613905 RepID=UPI0010FB8AFD|nr:uncharacterized protein LOC114934810 [Nylanderia fulva]
MDSLLGEKAYIQPPAEASSEGPSQPILSTSGSLSPASFSEDLRSAPKKRRVENILKNYIDNIKQERETTKKERDEERKKKEEIREAKYEEKKREREKMHQDNMEVQKSLLAVLQNFANKKNTQTNLGEAGLRCAKNVPDRVIFKCTGYYLLILAH